MKLDRFIVWPFSIEQVSQMLEKHIRQSLQDGAPYSKMLVYNPHQV